MTPRLTNGKSVPTYRDRWRGNPSRPSSGWLLTVDRSTWTWQGATKSCHSRPAVQVIDWCALYRYVYAHSLALLMVMHSLGVSEFAHTPLSLALASGSTRWAAGSAALVGTQCHTRGCSHGSHGHLERAKAGTGGGNAFDILCAHCRSDLHSLHRDLHQRDPRQPPLTAAAA